MHEKRKGTIGFYFHLAGTLILLSLAGCSSKEPADTKFTPEKLRALMLGMSESEVQEILGTPQPKNQSTTTIKHPNNPLEIIVVRYKNADNEAILYYENRNLSYAELNEQKISLTAR